MIHTFCYGFICYAANPSKRFKNNRESNAYDREAIKLPLAFDILFAKLNAKANLGFESIARNVYTEDG